MQPIIHLFRTVVLLAAFSTIAGCRPKGPAADLPDLQTILDGIRYLDTLITSDRIDSIGMIRDQITLTLEAYANRAQTPDDRVMLDSLNQLGAVSHDLLTFCSSTQSNLELLEQDVKTLENQYRSGKVKITEYVTALMESEQLLIDLDNQLDEKHHLALQLLRRKTVLTSRLSPLPGPGN